VDVLHAWALRYCVRQDARGFIELWALVVALAAAALSIRRASSSAAVALACLVVLSVGFGLITFSWCYEAAAPSLGLVVGAPPKNINFMTCIYPHVVETIDGWIVIVLSCVAGVALVLLGIAQRRSASRRAFSFVSAVAVFLFAIINVGGLLFGISWCQSSRLF